MAGVRLRPQLDYVRRFDHGRQIRNQSGRKTHLRLITGRRFFNVLVKNILFRFGWYFIHPESRHPRLVTYGEFRGGCQFLAPIYVVYIIGLQWMRMVEKRADKNRLMVMVLENQLTIAHLLYDDGPCPMWREHPFRCPLIPIWNVQ